MTVTVVKMSFNFCFGDVGMFAIENTTFFKLDAGCPESPKTVWHCFPCSQDLKCSVISLICLHFQIKPVWCADWDACDVLFSMKTQLLDIIDKLRICINDLYIYMFTYTYIQKPRISMRKSTQFMQSVLIAKKTLPTCCSLAFWNLDALFAVLADMVSMRSNPSDEIHSPTCRRMNQLLEDHELILNWCKILLISGNSVRLFGFVHCNHCNFYHCVLPAFTSFPECFILLGTQAIQFHEGMIRHVGVFRSWLKNSERFSPSFRLAPLLQWESQLLRWFWR